MEEENKTQTPVLGHSSNKIIGHWDEVANKFTSLNEEIMKETMNIFMAGNSIYPLAVRVTDNKIDGAYLTYRAIGSNSEDPRVIIYVYEDDNKKLTALI
jgi:hypothetical protein|tara:strand:- start:611 stop:907 length:297 start_codon:yes stop_codon:yes gene_type:complete